MGIDPSVFAKESATEAIQKKQKQEPGLPRTSTSSQRRKGRKDGRKGGAGLPRIFRKILAKTEEDGKMDGLPQASTPSQRQRDGVIYSKSVDSNIFQNIESYE
jgi:hypothetical protein